MPVKELLQALLWALLWALPAVAQPTFQDVSAAALPANLTRATSLAWGDYDNDGWPDLCLSGVGGDWDRVVLLRNRGEGRFADDSAAITSPVSENRKGGGAIFGDYDNDGDLDLFVPVGSWLEAERGPNMLLRNKGGRFVDMAREAGLTDSLQSDNAVWVDLDRDGLLDLYVANPGATHNSLYRNRGDGTFEDLQLPEGLVLDDEIGGRGNGVATADFDDDGWPDLYVAVFQKPNRLYLNDGRGGLVDATSAEIGDPGEAYDVAVGDIDNDGLVDLFQASGGASGGQRSPLLLNQGGGHFIDITEAAGIETGVGLETASSRGAGLADLDSDGDLDLVVGYPSRLFVNDGAGTFTQVSSEAAGLLETSILAFGDYDLDGALDVAGVAISAFLLRNTSIRTHWLELDLVGTASNRDGIGAKVTATTGGSSQVRQVLGGTGYTQDETVAHFGLGPAARVDELVVRWPSGHADTLRDLAADRRLRVIEGQGIGHAVTPMRLSLPAAIPFGAGRPLAVHLTTGLFEPGAIVHARVDLSPLGGPPDLELHPDGDAWTAQVTLDVPGPNRSVDVEAVVEQETSVGRTWARPVASIVVAPVATLAVSGDELAPGWTLEAARSVDSLAFSSAEPFDGDGALRAQTQAAFAGWWIRWTAPAPVPRAGYRLTMALRPQFGPDPEGTSLGIAALRGKPFDLIADGSIDPARDEWQTVDVPLEAMDGSGDLTAIQLVGSFVGVVWVDALRLVPVEVAPPVTAVTESHTPTTPAAFALHPAYPNPFNPETTISFDLPASADLELAVFDLLGQRVATLVRGTRAAGYYAVRWDGRSDAGRALASGLYLVRLSDGAQAQSRKLLLVR